MLKQVNFHSRILLSIVGVLLLALCGAATAMYLAANRASMVLAQQQLAVANSVLGRALEARDQQLRESTKTVAADFGFKEAVTSQDSATMLSALENQSARLQSDVAALVDNAGFVTLSTDSDLDSSTHAALLNAQRRDKAHEHGVSLINFKGKLLQIVAVPVRAPDTIGWICMGFFVGDEVLDQVKETTGTDVTLVVSRADSLGVVASTLPAEARASLRQNAGVLAGGRDAFVYPLRDESYLTLVAVTEAAGYSVLLQRPMSSVLAPMQALRRDLLLSGGVVLAICLLAALFSARILAKPVRALGDAARSLSMSKRSGEAKSPIGDNELAHVAKAFHALVKRAHFDALTGLPNRSLFNARLAESLEQAQKEKRSVAVVFIDLNGFKAINDKLGHEMGDLVLRKTAQRLSRSIAATNTVARLGGDEFVLILRDISQADALTEVDRLIGIVSMPMKAPLGSIKVGMSAGIAVYPDLNVDRETLLKCADAAMYESKTQKRGPVLARPATPVKNDEPPPSKASARPPAANPESDTWTGHWEGKDLATQRSKIVRIVKDKPGWQAAQKPDDEVERLAALRAIDILDKPPSASVDRVTRMAAKALRVPVVLVSLVDENRQWFMSRVGTETTETPRDDSFCAHVVHNRRPLIVGDTQDDERFADGKLVTGEANVRAYAGAPVYSDGGFALGTLCAIDHEPHEFTDKDVDLLLEFSSIVEDLVQAQEVTVRKRKKQAIR